MLLQIQGRHDMQRLACNLPEKQGRRERPIIGIVFDDVAGSQHTEHVVPFNTTFDHPFKGVSLSLDPRGFERSSQRLEIHS